MLYRSNIDYDKLVKNEKAVVDYLIKTSDYFSVVVRIKKPYSQMPPLFNYADQLRPFIIKYLFESKEWPVEFIGAAKHRIMVICKCCKEIRKEVGKIPNVFLPIENEMPEDICFYRDGELCFATISHEKMAFFTKIKKEDIDFFMGLGIHIPYSK